jgi:SP family sugar:H+ symporter-like MFS transporter
MLND